LNHSNIDIASLYLLPEDLIEAVQQELPNAIPLKALELEARLSHSVDSNVAVRDERPVAFIRSAAFAKPVSKSDCQPDPVRNVLVRELITPLTQRFPSP
jgi:hypothetical protein